MRSIPRLLLICTGFLLLYADAAEARRVPVPQRIPERNIFNLGRLLRRTRAYKVARLARRAKDPAAARRVLNAYFRNQSNLARTSTHELSRLLRAAPDVATRDRLFKTYVRYWTPSIGKRLHRLMQISGKGLNSNQDYLILRRARQRVFKGGARAAAGRLEAGNARDDVMWYAAQVRSTPRPGRNGAKMSTRDFLLTRYARAMGTDLPHARSELRTWNDKRAAEDAAQQAQAQASFAQTMHTLTTIQAMQTMNQVNRTMNQPRW